MESLKNTSSQETLSAVENDTHARSFPIWVGFLVLAAIVGVVGYYYAYVYRAPVSALPETVTAVLSRENTAFAEADSLYRAGNFSAARVKFEEALSRARDLAQESQIKLKIAHVIRDEGNYIQAVRLYKEIAVNEAYPARTRAYAAQAIAVLADFINDPRLREEIFNTKPFAEFFVAENAARSNRQLFEYAASLYPLALSELNVALWYANQLRLNALGLGRQPFPQSRIDTFHAHVVERMERAEADIALVANDPNDSVLLPEILRVKALTFSSLAFAGFATHEEAERTYQDALTAYTQQGVPDDAHMRLWYAYYLTGFEERRADVVTLVSPLYTDSAYRSSAIEIFLAAERRNVSGAKGALRIIGITDPEFKKYLISLGWTEADFE